MNILPLIKTGELLVNRYGKQVDSKLIATKNKYKVQDRQVVTFHNSIYTLSYILDTYFRTLSYITEEFYLQVLFKDSRLEIFYIY